ncbi:hypothetical protein BG03_71 [Bacillus cereus]|nr:hypothetical protein BG03_71 [Bacillus cereus]
MENTINNKLAVSEIKERLMDARELRNSLTSHMANEVMPRVRQARSNIKQDKYLTSDGKAEKSIKLGRQQEVKLFGEISQLKETYTQLLQGAKESAEAILIGGVSQPGEKEQKLFDIKKKKLQSAVMFAPTTNGKIKALREFAQLGEKGQAFAQQIQPEFMAMSQQAMANTTRHEDLSLLTKSLGQISKSLESHAFSEEQKEASSLLESIDAQLHTSFVNMAVLGGKLMEISKDAHDYANNLEGYEVDHADRVAEYNRDTHYGLIIE